MGSYAFYDDKSKKSLDWTYLGGQRGTASFSPSLKIPARATTLYIEAAYVNSGAYISLNDRVVALDPVRTQTQSDERQISIPTGQINSSFPNVVRVTLKKPAQAGGEIEIIDTNDGNYNIVDFRIYYQ